MTLARSFFGKTLASPSPAGRLFFSENAESSLMENQRSSGVDQAVVSPAAISITAMAPWRSRPNCSGLDEAA
jgi:hypothetical protein